MFGRGIMDELACDVSGRMRRAWVSMSRSVAGGVG